MSADHSVIGVRASAAEIGMTAEVAVAALAHAGGAWRHFSCQEIDAVAELFRAVGRPGDAATILVHHSDADEDGDAHVEIGVAYDEEAEQAMEWTDRRAYRLAVEYVAAL